MYTPRFFTLSELTHSDTANRLNIDNIPDFTHVDNLSRLCELVLDPTRVEIDMPIRVTSAYRSKALNKAVGGVTNSQHVKGLAADIVCDDMRALAVALGNNTNIDQCIKETSSSGFVWYHVSVSAKGIKPRQQYFSINNKTK